MYAAAPANLSKQPQGSVSYLQPGDAVIFNASFFPPYGHIAVVGSVSGSSGQLYSENTGANNGTGNNSVWDFSFSGGTITVPGIASAGYVTGVVHRPGTPPPTNSPQPAYGGVLRYATAAGHWATTMGGVPAGAAFEETLGQISMVGLPGTTQLFSCLSGTDQFVSADPGCEGRQVVGSIGYAFNAPVAGQATLPLVRCTVISNGTHFVSNDPNCEGQHIESTLGYSLATLSGWDVTPAPTGAQAIAGDTTAAVSWLAPAANVSSITSYTVTATDTTNATNGGQTSTVLGGPPALDAIVNGLVDGDSYTFTVTATNAVGTSSPSAASNSVTPTGTAPIVSSVPTVALNPAGKVSNSSPTAAVSVTVSWGVTAGSVPVCSQAVQVSINGGSTWKSLPAPAAVATSLTTTMTAGKAAEFRVQAAGCDHLLSSWATSSVLTARILQETSSVVAFSAGWSVLACTACSGGSQEQASTNGATATVTLAGVQGVAIVLSNGPANGQADVTADGGTPILVNTHATATRSLRFGYTVGWSTDGAHNLVLTALGTSGHPEIQVDAIVTLG